MVMKIMDNLVEIILKKMDGLGKTSTRNIFLALIFVPFLFLITMTYYFKIQAVDLAKKVQGLDLQIAQVADLECTYNGLTDWETGEETFLGTNTLATSLEAFIESKLGTMTLDPGWKEQAKISAWIINPEYEEKKLSLTFKKVSTQQLVEFLQALAIQQAIIIRELTVSKAADSLAVQLLLSYRYKKS